ncbi:recombinase family protein [Chelativorans sp. M5D2P16]|uniref:recombinase family protein n=1 Tax=Chelativorans sp. M5D2P16 TaxID=3095678 RepID=UPI002ACA58C3|nr:recombinase family protein [Chelativorans sp. M5D2P16]MDZ5696654.1 recombinase family protein [Chelativorans sp. M5D2P16]
MILRPGIQMLLQNAQAGQFDVVLAEALDRISRDQADVATFYKHLTFAGVPIVTLEQAKRSAPRKLYGPPQQPQKIRPDSSDFGRRAPFRRFFL